MTRRQEIELECPSCHSKGSFEYYSSTNVSLDPSLKERVLDGSLFVYECPCCNEKTFVTASCLYHDMDKRLFCYLIPDVEDTSQLENIFETIKIGGIDSVFLSQGYIIRMVPDLPSLKEKIIISDFGLDDRIIELIKVYIRALASEETEGYSNAEIRFGGIDEGDNLLVAVFAGGESFEATVPMSFYTELLEAHDFKDRDDCLIDEAWALSILNEGD